MCTASWLMTVDGYELFCNRDERRTREPAFPPRLKELNGVKYLAPEDGDFGGSWIGVNEFGLSLCLLNHYPSTGVVAIQAVSRGLLLLSLMDCRSHAEIARRLEDASLVAYRPFVLLCVEPRHAVAAYTWDGVGLSNGEAQMPMSTSSFDSTNVVARRKDMFAQVIRNGINAAVLEAYHKSRDPKGGAYSVCMSRDDAESVSFSRVRVTTGRIEFHYSPRSPLTGMFEDARSLSWARRPS